MLTTEIQVLKAFVKMPIIKVFMLFLLLPSGVFGWLWYDNQQIILSIQDKHNQQLLRIQYENNQKVEKIYQHFLEKTEQQIERIQEIEKKQLQ